MRTNSGYFFVESKFAGSTIMLWIFRARFDVNQKCLGDCQSIALACATEKFVIRAGASAPSSTRTSSAGSTDDPHSATITGACAAARSEPYTPRRITENGRASPRAVGALKILASPESSATTYAVLPSAEIAY